MSKLHATISLIFLMMLVVTALPSHAQVPENHVRIHFQREAGSYAGWGLHVWGEGLDLRRRVSWTNPMPPRGQDDFGIYFDVPIKPSLEEFGFIIHRGQRKSVEQDLVFNLVRDGREVWMYESDPTLHPVIPDLLDSAVEPTTGLHQSSATAAPQATNSGAPVDTPSATFNAAERELLSRLKTLLTQNQRLSEKLANHQLSSRDREQFLRLLQQENGQLQLQLMEVQAEARKQESRLLADIRRLSEQLQHATMVQGINANLNKSLTQAPVVGFEERTLMAAFSVMLLLMLWFYIRVRRKLLHTRHNLLMLQAGHQVPAWPGPVAISTSTDDGREPERAA